MGSRLKVGIVTQSDPFYLADTIRYLLLNLPTDHIEIVVAVVFAASPFGKRLGLWDMTVNTLRIFGVRFLMHYGLRFVRYRLDPSKRVTKVLRAWQIPVITDIQNPNSEDSIKKIMRYEPDILVSIGGNRIFKNSLICAAPKGMLNLHTALLPKYRGLMPTFWVLKNDEKETGVSVFCIDEGIDTGDIISQRRVPIHGQTQEELIKETKQIGMDALIEATMAIKTDTVKRMPNSNESSTYYGFPTSQDVKEFYRRGKKFF